MNGVRLLLRTAGIPIFIFACSSPNPEPPGAVAQVAQVQNAPPAAIPSDSSAVATSSEIVVDQGQKPMAKALGKSSVTDETTPAVAVPRAPAMAPNTTRAVASVVSYEDQGKSYLVVLRIQRVIGRGAATPPLAEGNEITVNGSKTLDQGGQLARSGATVEVTVQHRLPPALVKPTPPAWSILTVH